eukprot:6181867-Pleurochrysis_carterae.AAC.1
MYRYPNLLVCLLEKCRCNCVRETCVGRRQRDGPVDEQVSRCEPPCELARRDNAMLAAAAQYSIRSGSLRTTKSLAEKTLPLAASDHNTVLSSVKYT